MDRQAVAAALGGHPVAGVLKGYAKVVAVTGIFVAVVALFDRKAGAVLFMLWAAVVVMWVGAFNLGRLLSAFVHARLFNAAVDAVASGGLRADWSARSSVCGGILVVDEGARLLFVNDSAVGFDRVRHLRTSSDGRNRHRLEVTLSEGAVPVKEVYFDSEASMRQTAARLGNALGFGPA